jgi:hypothetical protein
MADWMYDTNTNTLTSPNGTSWVARSGPFGNGALPSGTYTIGSTSAIDSGPGNASFRDPAGNAWWTPLTPNFATTRTSIGIHPDGGTPGTEGCIGVRGNNTTSARRALGGAAGQTLVVR